MADWVDIPFAAAVRYLKGLKPTPRDVFDLMSLESKQRAFTVAHISKLSALQDVLDALEGAAESGMTLAEFIDRFEPLGLSDAHLETIFRTNLQTSFGRGRYEQLVDPAIGSAIWGWEYRTTGDDRVRESHQALNGLRFKAGQHDEIFPPWDYNCRCSSHPITKREARENDYEPSELPAEAQEALGETDFASPALGMRYQPDMGGFDVALVSEFLKDEERAAGSLEQNR